MSTTFSNAPLVELIAELRWASTSPVLSSGEGVRFVPGHGFLTAETNSLESFFTSFGEKASALNFTTSERLLPQGFPFMANQPVFRFRPSGSTPPSSLYQIGPGLFTANAVPPYKSWDAFSPIIRAGVDALLASRISEEADEPFASTSLRYIDAFTGSLIEGKSVADFLHDVFGISVVLPVGLTKHLDDGAQEIPALQLQIPMANGVVMNVGIGEGVSNQQRAIILDTTVVTAVPIAPTVTAVMDALESAHDVIHEIFFELTKPISELMKPNEETL